MIQPTFEFLFFPLITKVKTRARINQKYLLRIHTSCCESGNGYLIVPFRIAIDNYMGMGILCIVCDCSINHHVSVQSRDRV